MWLIFSKTPIFVLFFWAHVIALCQEPMEICHYSLIVFPSSELFMNNLLRQTLEVVESDLWLKFLSFTLTNRAVRYENIYRMDEIKSISFHIMFYRLFCGVAKYIVYGNTFSSFEWLRSLFAAHHGAWTGDRSRMRMTSQDKTRSSFLNEGLHL